MEDEIQEVAQPQENTSESVQKERFNIEDLTDKASIKSTNEVNNESQKVEGSNDPAGKPEKSHENNKPKTKAEAEIARMTRQKYEMRDRIEALEKQLESLKPKKESGKGESLKRSDFESEEDYFDYREQKLLENIHNKQMESYNKAKESQEKVSSWEQNILENFKTQEELETYAENIANISPLLEKIPSDAQTFIYGSKVGSKIVNWFGENPSQLERFLNEHPYRQPQVLLALENHLSKSIGSNQGVVKSEKPEPKQEEKKPIGTLSSGINKSSSRDGDSIEDILASIRSKR
jgi:hypothetical protein